jgi:hypothetical protein
MHHNVVGYDDYDDYDYYLGHVDDFLAYDAFAWAAEEPMPYEGFSRGIIPELGHYRHSHQQERADYSEFRAADKQYGAEDPRDRDELAEAHEEIHDTETADEGLAEAAAGAVAADHALDMVDAS